jgi:hypothetical protein
MMGCSRCGMKRRALVWRLSAGLLAVSAAVLIAIPGANAATADRPPVGTAQPAAPPMQSCDDAYDQTGVGGAGIGQIRAGGNGVYSFDIKFNQDFIAAHPPTTDFLWGEVRVFVNGSYAFSIPTGHPRPLHESFHGLIKLQGLQVRPSQQANDPARRSAQLSHLPSAHRSRFGYLLPGTWHNFLPTLTKARLRERILEGTGQFDPLHPD